MKERDELIENVRRLAKECHEKGYSSLRLFTSEAEALLAQIEELSEENRQFKLLMQPVEVNLEVPPTPLTGRFPWRVWLPYNTLEELEAASDADLLALYPIGPRRLEIIRNAQRNLRRESGN